MVLIACPNCSRQISSQAIICPGCGRSPERAPSNGQGHSSSQPGSRPRQQWCIKTSDGFAGPISSRQLKELAASGKLVPDALVSPDQTRWCKASQVRGLVFVSASPMAANASAEVAFFDLEHNEDDGITAVIEQFKALKLATIFPRKELASLLSLKHRTARWVAALGLAPIFLNWVVAQFGLGLGTVALTLSAYFCIVWAACFYYLIQPAEQSWKRGLRYATITCFVGLPILCLLQAVTPIGTHYAHALRVTDAPFSVVLFSCIVVVGICEEVIKAIPLLFSSWKWGLQFDSRAGMFLGAMSGFGFAFGESVFYTVVVYAPTISTYEDAIAVQLTRFISCTLLHGAYSAVTGFFIATGTTNPAAKWPAIFVGIGLTAVLHGLYDAFVDSLVGVIVGFISVTIFFSYVLFARGRSGTAKPNGQEVVNANLH